VRFGLTPDDILSANPNAIYALLTAYGTDGPDADMGGFDIQAFYARTGITGMLSLQAGAPPRPRSGQGDHITTLVIMTGILAALRRRARTGQGQVVETSLVAVGSYTIGSDILLALGGHEARGPVHPLSACYQCSDDRWLQLGVSERDRDHMWRLLCELLGVAREARADAAANAAVNAIADAFVAQSRETWGERLTDAGIAWVPVQTLPEVIADPQLEANGMIGTLEHPQHGSIRFVNAAYRVEGMTTREPGCGPRIGEHTVEVLRELGFEATEIEELGERGVFGERR
jgi:crotonobetainyl-CoA:carnitine CoA-transferase CaiB-like acyl-CoA transferase